MISEDWQNNFYGSRDSRGFKEDYITRGGLRKEGLHGLNQGTYIKYIEVEFLLRLLSYEETIHMFSLKK